MAEGPVDSFEEFKENIPSNLADAHFHSDTKQSIENDSANDSDNSGDDDFGQLPVLENTKISASDDLLTANEKIADNRNCRKVEEINFGTENDENELSEDVDVEDHSILIENKIILGIYTSRKQKLNMVQNNADAVQPASISETEKRSESRGNDVHPKTTSRPTLADDSRLVKISLAANPMNLMQSNAQFLNKSRKFINFITEKSTNIILPQNMAHKYGPAIKQSEPAECPIQNGTSIDDVASPVTIKQEKMGTFSIDETLEEETELNKNSKAAETCSDSKGNCLPREDLRMENVECNEGSNDLLHHPVYSTLLQDHTALKHENSRFLDRIRQLEEKNQQLEAEKSGELYMAQIKTLEKTVDRLTQDLKVATATQETLGKDFAAANKERESMVMKYAIGEKQLIQVQRARDTAEQKLKDLMKGYELLQAKLRQGQSERVRICNILDSKCSELVENQKQVEKLKEDVNIKDSKLKWVQNKFKSEMETHKETQQKLEKATGKINEMKEECELVRRETQETMRKFQTSEENKAVTLDQQLKEEQARLILERHVTVDKEMLRVQLQKEVDSLKHRQEVLIEENNSLSLKVQDLEKERLNYESDLSNLKIVADQRQKDVVDLTAKVSELETLKIQLKQQKQCLSSTEAEVERLRQSNEELQMDMDACRQREAHMLDFTQKLTDKNVRLQSEFSSIEAKTHRLAVEQGPLRERIIELQTRVKSLEESLAEEQKKRLEECEILAKKVAEQTQLAENLARQLEDSQGENAVLKRKHQLSLKEMTRELHQYRKRLETFETGSPSNSLDHTSRTGSNASLNTGDALNGASSDTSNYGDNTVQSLEPDRHTLIDHINKLTKINVERAERLDFLKEHNRTLVEELKKKTKIIQNYILHGNFDAMGSNEREKNKAELARHGGIMASVYNHKVSDDNMTLQLSLEINQKLQAVLEDTLLKNITLKDNIETLGEEIEILTLKNQQRK